MDSVTLHMPIDPIEAAEVRYLLSATPEYSEENDEYLD